MAPTAADQTSTSPRTAAGGIIDSSKPSTSQPSTPATSASSPVSEAPSNVTPSSAAVTAGRSALPKAAPSLKPRPKNAPVVSRPASPTQPPPGVMTMAAVISPNPAQEAAPRISMTSKEWIIPPRPKPGRKPATDTPPTKRKAQNRAAQRAFRERRAARVGELEEQLDQQKEEQDKQQKELKDKVHGLELELESFRSRCLLLETMLDKERKERIRAETDLDSHKRREGISSSITSRKYSVQSDNVVTSVEHSINEPARDIPLTCGKCTPTGPCACVDEVLASASAECGRCGVGMSCKCLDDLSGASAHQDLKRPGSPSQPNSNEKRQRSQHDTSDSETDFTSFFSRTSTAATNPFTNHSNGTHFMSDAGSLDTSFLKDSCGFCKDGTYCVCAEASTLATPAATPTENILPPISQQQTHTPPPSETDFTTQPMILEMTAEGAVKLPRRKQTHARAAKPASRGGCNGKPGTCAQCQADPKSGLFCRLMAANFDREKGGSGSGGCCGGKGASGGCCKSSSSTSPSTATTTSSSAAPTERPGNITLPSLPSLGLSCAEAYQTLSSHRNFDRAADDIGSWLPKLKATPRPVEGGAMHQQPSRMPIDVEAASIMSVLKDFDVRFGRDA